jgi:hypothetical protein
MWLKRDPIEFYEVDKGKVEEVLKTTQISLTKKSGRTQLKKEKDL